MSGAVNMSSWTWVAKTLKNLRLATPTSSSIPGSVNVNVNVKGSTPTQQSRLMSATAAPTPRSAGSQVVVPPKPKKPLTPYFRFLGQVREDIRKDHPNLKITELMKKVGAQWDKLDESGKGRYISAYRKDMESYASTLDKYKKSLTPEQAAMGEQIKMEKEMKKEKREKRRRIKELGRPKRPMTAFLLYLRSQAKEGQNIAEYQRLAKELGGKWKGMSASEKAPFMSTYKEAYEQYEKDLKRWEDKMLKQGNEDLVRISYLTNKVAAAAKTKAQTR